MLIVSFEAFSMRHSNDLVAASSPLDRKSTSLDSFFEVRRIVKFFSWAGGAETFPKRSSA
jgi:hypothetical protein